MIRARRALHALHLHTHVRPWPSHPPLCLWQVADLLKPCTFTEQAHVWVVVHNRIQRGHGSEEDMAMANRARECAKKLDLKTTIVVKGAKPTGLPKVLEAVLKEQCAMQPDKPVEAQLGSAGAREKRTLTSWQILELAPGCAERMLVWHDRLGTMIPAAEYRSQEQQHIDEQVEREQQRRLAQANAEYDAEMGGAEALDLSAGIHRPVAPAVAPYDPNVMYEPYDAAKIKECLDDCSADRPQREAALQALLTLSTKRANTPGLTNDDPQLREMHAWQRLLRKWGVRHSIVAALDASLPPPDEEGRRSLRVEYEYKAGGDAAGRRYAKLDWTDFGDGERRCISLQGMPGDLRPKLTGKWLFDIDGVKSDPSIIVNEARRARLPLYEFKWHSNFISYPDEWIDYVAKCYAPNATPEAMSALKAQVKRWPNKLDNGSGIPALLEAAGLPANSSQETKLVIPYRNEAKQLRIKLLNAPCNAAFVKRHKPRLQRENEGISEDKLEVKVFNLLIATREDQILQINVATKRRLNRDAYGAAEFDAMPVERRDSGSLIFDGHMPELNPTVAQRVDANGRLELLNTIESDLATQGSNYKVAVKPNFGLQDEPVESVVKGRAALDQAVAKYPEVCAAVEAVSVGAVQRPGGGGERRRFVWSAVLQGALTDTALELAMRCGERAATRRQVTAALRAGVEGCQEVNDFDVMAAMESGSYDLTRLRAVEGVFHVV